MVTFSSYDNEFWLLMGSMSSKSKLPTEKNMLWHIFLFHIGDKGLQTLKNKNLVNDLNDFNPEFDFSENYLYG